MNDLVSIGDLITRFVEPKTTRSCLFSYTEVISMFGVETILLFTAMLLKKRIVVHHPNFTQLADICR